MTEISIDLQNVVFHSLNERVAIITGAGQGIGRVFAKTFAAAGARAVIAEFNEKKGRCRHQGNFANWWTLAVTTALHLNVTGPFLCARGVAGHA